MKILIDGDACPKAVLQICLEIGRQYGIPVWTVASFNHEIASDHHIIVGNSPQETDIKVMNLCEAGDIIVTQDIGLAAMVLGKGGRALSPAGKEYRPELIANLLEERELKAKYRRSGGRTKGPAKRSPVEDQVFEETLLRFLRK
ncbi:MULTISPECIES: DUF188 domain-containing protein [Desulfitobacterium]|uniref:Uncharacterized protein n=1 Tax=Desulfitobacterium dehalogenans (strain ATCC 51507 / DSM 9161 / JW/IU-DC1) TaxID=756499 RepID=I4AAL5_DESDJ|nr:MULTISPECIES: DUF188 domain-containing protein [Desulfitobacterium]AFM01000.1 hypothetical protein Desde_2686 [Desulfitobacterium dehalogenans ATCC 51507]